MAFCPPIRLSVNGDVDAVSCPGVDNAVGTVRLIPMSGKLVSL